MTSTRFTIAAATLIAAIIPTTAMAQQIGQPTGKVIEVQIRDVSPGIDGDYQVPELDYGRWGGKQYSAPAPFGRIQITNGQFGRGIGVALSFNRAVVRTRTYSVWEPGFGNQPGRFVPKVHRTEIPSRISYGTGAANVTTDSLTQLTMPAGENNDPDLAGGRVGSCIIRRIR